MNNSTQKSSIFVLISIFLFCLFWWLFNMGMPGAGFEFALGLTIILMSGLLAGRYTSKIWRSKNVRFQNTLLIFFSLLILCGLVGIALLINKMIQQTEFIYFALTVLFLFIVSALFGAILSLLNHRIRKEIQQAHSVSAHSKSELQLLQSQLSPHFLFNTLNNLYGLSITDHEKLPTLLLKLSELLRYSVYDTKEIFVSLNDEISYLKNYIDFERIRLGDRLDIEVKFPDPVETAVQIAPMLLIIFVENAFKHAANSYEEKININLNLVLQDQQLLFTLKNSFQNNTMKLSETHKHAGFGLENVKKRLDLLYKDEHTLKIEESENEFKVNLMLKCK